VNASSSRGLLLDTNIVIAMFAGAEDLKWKISYDLHFAIPSVVAGELLYGAHYSTEIRQNLREIEGLIDSIDVLSCDVETARHYGMIKGDLRSQGRLIPDNDLWIAAIAIQNGLTLVTRDSHFRAISSLLLEEW
jgi:tRNA(fMet)-specific endonuclease VapC